MDDVSDRGNVYQLPPARDSGGLRTLHDSAGVVVDMEQYKEQHASRRSIYGYHADLMFLGALAYVVCVGAFWVCPPKK